MEEIRHRFRENSITETLEHIRCSENTIHDAALSDMAGILKKIKVTVKVIDSRCDTY